MKKKKTEFNKIFATLVSLCLGAYGLYAGFAYYVQVNAYYETVQYAIDHQQEYMSICQPDPTLAVACVTTLLGSFLTYCSYNGALKLSLNSNDLALDKEGYVNHIHNEGFEDDSKLNAAG